MEQQTEVKRTIVPKNGATFFVVGIRDFYSVTYPELRRYNYSSASIDGSNAPYNQLPKGTVVAYKTKENRLGKFVIDEYGYNLNIRWITYANKT